jgi:hypothetical protein
VETAHFTKGGYVGTYDSAPDKKPLSYWQAKALRLRWGDERFASSVTPLQLWIGQATKQKDTVAKAQIGYQLLNLLSLRAVDADDEQLHALVDRRRTKQAMKGPNQEEDILVSAVLCNA